MLIFLIFSLVISVLAVIFALQNTAQVMVTFFAWKLQGSLALILLGTLITGAIASYFAQVPGIIKDKWRLRSDRKRITEMEATLTVTRQKLEETERKLAEIIAEKTAAPAPLPAPAQTHSGSNGGKETGLPGI
jgi:uncharacterized integral membrane protein